MASGGSFAIHEHQLTIRFIQGYRYLDRCGEALVRLESVLGDGWLPIEAAPKGGGIKNDALGVVATFNTEAMTVQQSEFIAFETFLDSAGKIYDTLWQVFEIKRIIGPAMRIVLQMGFKVDE